ncbi:DUF6362 family protein [Thalassobaculum litoreum]|uniref:DUF6362 domain-containing protein n=1 Tax=Thalassobaculum litoreum DSM 18839 TaxID=1123362 RepID=A0A8G2EUW9_9PROT|nr:DUF6362 family protein [Thalassobaculum litoreum]SDF58733.1 hypothetical protein SAMN05660686_01771 [Thalassobaculum litoreum DSM 18839]
MAQTASAIPGKPASEATPDPAPLLLREAADTLRRLPRGLARPRLSSWPEVVRDSASLFASSQDAARRPSPPSPQAIDRMDRTLGWLLACDEEARRLVWARAMGISWRRLEDMDGRSHVTLRKIVARGHDRIRVLLAADDKKKPVIRKNSLQDL